MVFPARRVVTGRSGRETMQRAGVQTPLGARSYVGEVQRQRRCEEQKTFMTPEC